VLAPTTLAAPAARTSLTGPGAFPLAGVPQMLGDLPPIFGAPRVVATPPGTNAVRLPWVRGYKMADNQSPLPLDRVFATFYYYNDINLGPAASRAGLSDVDVYREFFGLEKTFLDRRASLGIRLPLNSIDADLSRAGRSTSSTSLGDLTVFGKYALWGDLDRAEVVSLGLAVTPPTGPAEFAGAAFARARNPTYLQPFLGYLKPFGRLYVQGFLGINVPTDDRVVTMLYNDFGAGYYLYRADRDDALLSAVVPAMEVHVNTPLNHRGGFSDVSDPGATFDSVNLTFGLNAVLRGRSVLSVGFVQSVSGPRPFDHEVIVLLNVGYGRRSRVRPPAVAPPMFGN
jgi:hypothetical protein